MDKIFGKPITKSERSRIMSRIRSKDTLIEIEVRKRLFYEGYRYRLHYNLPGKPDVVFPAKKLAIFINGCFWHGHGCNNSRLPVNNAEFWNRKLNTNYERDKRNIIKLNNLGWKVLVLWECEIENDIDKSIAKVTKKLL